MAEKISYLTFVKIAEPKNGKKCNIYKCVCGNEKIIMESNVKRFNTTSCGCKQKEAASVSNKTHGLRNHPLYQVWSNMTRRCYDKNSIVYNRYGGKGVTVCEEWKNSFKTFYDWAIKNGWKQGLQIDKDIKGGNCYSPNNCLIVTPKQNCNARTSNRFITVKNETKTLAEWSKQTGVPQDMISRRIASGWSATDAIFNPSAKRGESKNKRVLCVNNNKEFKSLTDAALFVGCSISAISDVCIGKINTVYGYSFKKL